ncbi:MAG TPA: hypothetical protein VGR67_13030 [Candidatus Polarisedimenticolia bacterium]|jgi:hypothetical protein|nr:hypothetical protein [Candidatus Polarisedimenticolia bacterium]
MKKKPYEKPAIVHSEKSETRALLCAKTDAGTCGPSGPITS